jgi:hypothetical protein
MPIRAELARRASYSTIQNPSKNKIWSRATRSQLRPAVLSYRHPSYHDIKSSQWTPRYCFCLAIVRRSNLFLLPSRPSGNQNFIVIISEARSLPSKGRTNLETQTWPSALCLQKLSILHLQGSQRRQRLFPKNEMSNSTTRPILHFTHIFDNLLGSFISTCCDRVHFVCYRASELPGDLRLIKA